jgi:protein TonB
MSSASLAISHRPHLDATRIAGISAAIALNLAVIVMASRPITPTQLAALRHLTPVALIRFINTPPKLLPPAPVELKPLLHPAVLPRVRQAPKPFAVSVRVNTDEGTLAAPAAAAPNLLPGADSIGTAEPATVVEASLAYRLAPLQFPIQALRQRMHGTVLLRVLVDETGTPLQVTVEHGSGHALLDRSAVQQVLSGWRFQPAIVDGHAVRAWARVPVNFHLDQ